MGTARMCETGKDASKWFAVDPGGRRHRVGYCARGCPGHDSTAEALAHYLQFLLDRESDLWLKRPRDTRACEI